MNLSHVRKKYQFRYIPVLSPQLRRTLRVLYICIERFDLLGVKNRKEQSLRNKVMMSYAYSLPAIFQVWSVELFSRSSLTSTLGDKHFNACPTMAKWSLRQEP